MAMKMMNKTESSKMMLTLIIIVIVKMTNSKKVVVKYFGEDYLVDGGCKAKDETVLKYVYPVSKIQIIKRIL